MNAKERGENLRKIKEIVTGVYRPDKTMFCVTPENSPKVADGHIMYEDGVKYVMENGQRIPYEQSQIAQVKDNVIQLANPKCPDCGGEYFLMTHPADLKMMRRTGRCLKCQVKHDDELKIKGQFRQYEQERMAANAKSILRDAHQIADEYIQQMRKQYIETVTNEFGDVERWEQPDMSEDIKKIESQLETMANDLQSLENDNGVSATEN